VYVISRERYRLARAWSVRWQTLRHEHDPTSYCSELRKVVCRTDGLNAFGHASTMKNPQMATAAEHQLFIHLDQPYEVRYWTRVLGVDEETLIDLVRRVGPRADRIQEHLSRD
jgi:hypothetical protein